MNLALRGECPATTEAAIRLFKETTRSYGNLSRTAVTSLVHTNSTAGTLLESAWWEASPGLNKKQSNPGIGRFSLAIFDREIFPRLDTQHSTLNTQHRSSVVRRIVVLAKWNVEHVISGLTGIRYSFHWNGFPSRLSLERERERE